jgi:uncharacterized protein YjaZ
MARTIDIGSKTYYAHQALKWCKEYFGMCDRKRRKIIFKVSERKRKMGNCDVYGNYCFWRNTITLYLPNNTTIHDIVATMIHEYTHYLQSRTKYRNYEKTHYYSQNPLEKEAKRNEEKYTNMCIKHIKKNM